MKKITILLVSVILMSSIFIAGCNETDISKIVKNLPDVQQFMQEHPNADMKVVYLSDSVVATKINDIRIQCTEDVPQVVMYYVEFKEGANIDMKLWLDASTQQLLCALKKGSNNTFIPVVTGNVTEINLDSNIEIVYGLKAVMEEGDTITLNVSGKWVVVNLMGVVKEASPVSAKITINGESKLVSAGKTEEFSGIWVYLKRIFPSYAAPTKQGAVELFVGNDSTVTMNAKTTWKNNFTSISKEELIGCTKNSDCIAVNADDCGCYAGGKAISINKKHTDYWNAKITQDGSCAAVMSQDISCASEPKCISGSCELVISQNDESKKNKTLGESTTIFLKLGESKSVNLNGVQRNISFVEVDDYGEIPSIRVGNEVANLTIGTGIIDEFNLYRRYMPYNTRNRKEEWQVELFITHKDFEI
ncbi:MAG: hypothetical protein Q8O89_01280, partial [Nanoarchaeota archaeon]|nr:hypothetical protein [Nanoarchaeota archaeon]